MGAVCTHPAGSQSELTNSLLHPDSHGFTTQNNSGPILTIPKALFLVNLMVLLEPISGTPKTMKTEDDEMEYEASKEETVSEDKDFGQFLYMFFNLMIAGLVSKDHYSVERFTFNVPLLSVIQSQ